MAKAVVRDLDELRRWMKAHEARPKPLPEGVIASRLEMLDRILPGGGFPRGGVTVLRGVSGTGRMTVAASALAHETSEGRAAAWIDGRGTLYPPGLMLLGVQLERLLIVQPRDSTKAIRAAEQIIDSGAFGLVVASGVDEPMSAPRARRIQMAARGALVSSLFVLEPETVMPHVQLTLGFTRRRDRITVEIVKNQRGPTGQKASVYL